MHNDDFNADFVAWFRKAYPDEAESYIQRYFFEIEKKFVYSKTVPLEKVVEDSYASLKRIMKR
jgi:hypothetical protein